MQRRQCIVLQIPPCLEVKVFPFLTFLFVTPTPPPPFNHFRIGISVQLSNNHGQGQFQPQSTHRVAIATFWRTFHHDGKISPALSGGGGCKLSPFHSTNHHASKVVVYAPAEIHSPYFSSTPTCSPWMQS